MPPDGPFSVPDSLADGWSDMVRLSRKQQARHELVAFGRAGAVENEVERGSPQSPACDRFVVRQLSPGSMTHVSAVGMARGEQPVDDPRERPKGTPIDPAVTDVFRKGSDGKLHPISGWRTTGPFAFGAWAHNIDWGGVLRDLNQIASRSVVGGGLQGLESRRGATGVTGNGLSAADRLTLGAGIDAAGDATLDAVSRKKQPAHH